MTTRVAHLLSAIWIAVGTVGLAKLWLSCPAILPAWPASFAIWITDLYGARNAEEIADVEVILALSAAFLLVSIATFSAVNLWKKLRQRD